jgi:hypothetical protein
VHITTKTRCALRNSNVDKFQTPFESHLTAAAQIKYGELEVPRYMTTCLCVTRLTERSSWTPSKSFQPSNTLIRDNNEPPSCQTPTPRQPLLEIICQLPSGWLLKLSRYRHIKSNPKTYSSKSVEVAQSAYQLCHVRPSVRMYQPYQHVLAGFSLNMTLGDLYENVDMSKFG